MKVYQIHSATFESGVLDNQEVLDKLARLKRAGIVIGLTLSGANQAEVLGRAGSIARDGEPLFGCVQATWNLLEPSVGPALAEARAAGMGVIIKEALALAAALAQPWADVVLSGAATLEQLQSNVCALEIGLDRAAIGVLSGLAEDPATYWQTRSSLKWN